MGTSLNGLTPAGTYPGLIKTGDNAPIDGTLKTLSDGNGNNLPMEASTTAINFTNGLQQGGIAVPTASQVAAKQDTLVSGTNIKTINGISVLGSGNIVTPTTNPSGVSGAIQFSNGSAFASDAANLFWDDTNNRLGVGTNAPSATAHIVGANTSSSSYSLKVLNSVGQGILSVTNDGYTQIGDFTAQGYGSYLSFLRPSGATRVTTFSQGNSNLTITNTNGNVTFQNTPVQVVGSGSTSATTSLLVQNSAGTELFRVRDDGRLSAQSINVTAFPAYLISNVNVLDYGDQLRIGYDGSVSKVTLYTNGGTPQLQVNNSGQVSVGTTSPQASAKFEIASTTMGFLPPRMTTTQKNAISSPATGLVVYDSTTNKLCCYNGSTWNDLF